MTRSSGLYTWTTVLQKLGLALRGATTLRELQARLPRGTRLLAPKAWPSWALAAGAVAVVEVRASCHVVSVRAVTHGAGKLAWLGGYRAR